MSSVVGTAIEADGWQRLFEEALGHYQKGLEIRQKLAAAVPTEPGAPG